MRAAAMAALTLSLTVSTIAWGTPPATTYGVIDIPTLGGDMRALGINDRGDIVGVATAGAFVYEPGSGAVNALILGTPQDATFASGINESGHIAGYADTTTGVEAVLWSAINGSEALSSDCCAWGYALSNSEIIVGTAFDGIGSTFPVQWSGPQQVMASLGTLPCVHCVRFTGDANAINSRGHVAGSTNYAYAVSTDVTDLGTHAFEWQDGQMSDLGALNGSAYSVAYGINTSDEIVGASSIGRNTGDPIHAFRYSRGHMIDLGTLAGDRSSSAAAVNDRGQIVGWSGTDTGSRAFVYVNGEMHDLNSLIDPTSPLAGFVTLETASSINSKGWIAANGTDKRDSRQHAYLLSPSHPGAH